MNALLRLLPLLLLVAFAGGINGETAFGQRDAQKCGDRICGGNENCLTCRDDCLACSAAKECGDERCHLNEGENFEKCPEDCPPPRKEKKQARVAEAMCGDAVCSLTGEDCTVCPEDCGVCSDSWRMRLRAAFRRAVRFAQRLLREHGAELASDVRIFLQGSLATIEEQKRLMGEHALERSEAAEQLITFLAENEDVSRHLTTFDTRLIRRMSDRERANVITAVPALHIRSKIRRVALAERAAMVERAKVLMADPKTRELLQALPEPAMVLDAVSQGNLAALARILPAPASSDLPAILKELQELRTLLGPDGSREQRASLLSLLIARAQETAEKKVNTKDAFRDSVELAQHLREVARDSEAALPSLEERLSYLQGRRTTLAGVVHLPEDDVEKNLDRIQGGAGSASTKSLLNLVGIFRYLGSTANFIELEHAMNRALSSMRSGISRIRAFFAQSETPQAEAAALLTEEWGWEERQVEELQKGEHLEVQREAVRAFLAAERASLEEELMARLSASERQEFVERMLALEANALASAENPTELRTALGEIRAHILALQERARGKRPLFLRLLDPLHDFLL